MPAVSDEVVTLRGGGLMVNDSEAVAEPDALSLTRTVKLLDPAVEGVPEMVPLVRLKPAGSDPPVNDQVYGGVPPEAVRDCE